MILHLGSNVTIFTKEIVAILDLKTSKRHMSGEAVTVSDEAPRSLVITQSEGKKRMYLSPISSWALLRRCERPTFE